MSLVVTQIRLKLLDQLDGWPIKKSWKEISTFGRNYERGCATSEPPDKINELNTLII